MKLFVPLARAMAAGLTMACTVAYVHGEPLATAGAASAPLRFKPDADVVAAFPAAGVALMLALVALAAASLWWRKRVAGASSKAGVNRLRLFALPTLGHGDLKRISSLRLDATTRVHVVQWRGRELLIAVQNGAAPVLLDRAGEGVAGAAPTGSTDAVAAADSP